MYNNNSYRGSNNRTNDYGNRSYGNGGFNNSSHRSFGKSGYNAPKKHSGCRSGQDKKGRAYVSGWKYGKRSGLVSFFAAPYKGTSTHKSASGRVWQNWICKMQNKSTFEETITPCLYDQSTGKVIIKKLGFVMNPKGGRGGYVGTYVNN